MGGLDHSLELKYRKMEDGAPRDSALACFVFPKPLPSLDRHLILVEFKTDGIAVKDFGDFVGDHLDQGRGLEDVRLPQ